MSDVWLGKFKTILLMLFVYVFGSVFITIGAIPANLDGGTLLFIGMALIAIGSGGIKPCVAALGGDQFQMPEQASKMAKFFSIFYFASNAGSLLATAITPNLRTNVQCFGENDCYALAFGVPTILMAISIGTVIAHSGVFNLIIQILISSCVSNGKIIVYNQTNGWKYACQSHKMHYGT